MSKYHKPKLRFAQFCLTWIYGSSTFHAESLTLFCCGKIIHGVTYFDNAGQRLPVQDIATVMQYDTRAACSSHGARPEAVASISAVSLRSSVIYKQLRRRHT